MLIEINNIREVEQNDLCTGCGTCISICPNQAIKIIKNDSKGIYKPIIDNMACTSCGICYRICPGHAVDFMQLNMQIFGGESDNDLIGHYLNCYIGYSVEHNIRYNSASGGLITALLISALENGIVDGVLVTKMSKANPMEPQPFIARTKEDIISASKSKYCPVPANIAIKHILDNDGKFAIVGLPCHIQGIRKAEAINKNLKDKIVLHLGIFCNHSGNFLGIEYLLQKYGIKRDDVTRLDYRGEGWPGGMTIELTSSPKKFISLFDYWIDVFESYFIPMRCTLCSDETCELADISFGDIFLPEILENDGIGTSVIISRNAIGDKLIQCAISKGKIALTKISSEMVIQSQKGVLESKKRKISARFFYFRLFNKKIPTYNQKLLKAKPTDYLGAISFYFNIFIASNRSLWRILPLYTSIKSYPRKYALICGVYCYHKMKYILKKTN